MGRLFVLCSPLSNVLAFKKKIRTDHNARPPGVGNVQLIPSSIMRAQRCLRRVFWPVLFKERPPSLPPNIWKINAPLKLVELPSLTIGSDGQSGRC